MPNYTAIILSAGASSRMGEPKALLSYEGSSFLQHIYKITETVFHENVNIILGASAEKIIEALPGFPGNCFINKDWEKGMGTSIAFGTQMVLRQRPDTSGILFLTVDQPFITAGMLDAMLNTASKNPGSIIASEYGDSPGIPALFPAEDFPDLLSLSGAQGAKKILLTAGSRVLRQNINKATTDIDTPEQYQAIIRNR